MDKSFLFRNESNTGGNLQTGAVFIGTLTDRNILSLIKNPDIDENIRGLLLQEAEKRGIDFIDENYPETIFMEPDSQDLDQVPKEQGSQDSEDRIPTDEPKQSNDDFVDDDSPSTFPMGLNGSKPAELGEPDETDGYPERVPIEPIHKKTMEDLNSLGKFYEGISPDDIRHHFSLLKKSNLTDIFDDEPLPKKNILRRVVGKASSFFGRLVGVHSKEKKKQEPVVVREDELVREEPVSISPLEDASRVEPTVQQTVEALNEYEAVQAIEPEAHHVSSHETETVNVPLSEVMVENVLRTLQGRRLVEERIPLQNQNLLEKAKHHITQAVEGYKRAPLPAKLALSGALIGTSLIGAVTGSTLLVAGAIAGKALVRGAGSYIAGKTVEEYLSKPGKASSVRGKVSRIANVFGKHKARHEQDGEKLDGLRKHVFEVAEKNKNERFIRNAKWATMLSTFLLGSYADKDLMHVVGDKLHVLTDQFHQVFGESPSLSQHIPPSDIHPTVSEVTPTESAPPSLPTIAPQEVVSNYSSTGITHVYEVIARKGETLIGVLLRDGLTEILPIDDLDKLTPLGRQNLILNIVEKLTPEQLREVGILSGDKNLIQAGAHIDIKKIAEFARTMTVNTSEGKVGIIERALSLQS